jgi:hypothetical protein
VEAPTRAREERKDRRVSMVRLDVAPASPRGIAALRRLVGGNDGESFGGFDVKALESGAVMRATRLNRE